MLSYRKQRLCTAVTYALLRTASRAFEDMVVSVDMLVAERGGRPGARGLGASWPGAWRVASPAI